MKTFEIRVAVRTLEIYQVEAENAEAAREAWCDGELVHASDEALNSEILSVKEM